MAKHWNIQILVQEVDNIEATMDAYGKILRPADKRVREQRINVTGTTSASVFNKAKNALDVLADE